MKRSYSFLVEKENGLPLRRYEGGDYQAIEDGEKMNEIYPYPNKNGVFKITYTLAPKNGKFTRTNNTNAFFFKFSDIAIENPPCNFLNCIITTDWKSGTKFNRKVEIIKRGIK